MIPVFCLRRGSAFIRGCFVAGAVEIETVSSPVDGEYCACAGHVGNIGCGLMEREMEIPVVGARVEGG
jgi:hypothetical protein